MTEETKPQTDVQKPAAPAKVAAKKPTVEDLPFPEFMEQAFVPNLKKVLAGQGLSDLELTFTKDKLPIAGANPTDLVWQVRGSWQKRQRQFNLYFLEEDINGKKAFSCATNGVPPSTIESFMIDERKVSLDLLLLYTLQRLNGQKWLSRN